MSEVLPAGYEPEDVPYLEEVLRRLTVAVGCDCGEDCPCRSEVEIPTE